MRLLVLAAALLLLASTTRARDLHGIQGFDEFAEGHPGMAQALAKRPSLAQDPDYLKRHPELADYLHDNPVAKTQFQSEADDEEAEDEEIQQTETEDKTDQTMLRHRSLMNNSLEKAAKAGAALENQ